MNERGWRTLKGRRGHVAPAQAVRGTRFAVVSGDHGRATRPWYRYALTRTLATERIERASTPLSLKPLPSQH